MSACRIPEGLTLPDVERQVELWIATGERIRALQQKALAEGAPREVLLGMARALRASAVQTKKYDDAARALRGVL